MTLCSGCGGSPRRLPTAGQCQDGNGAPHSETFPGTHDASPADRQRLPHSSSAYHHRLFLPLERRWMAAGWPLQNATWKPIPELAAMDTGREVQQRGRLARRPCLLAACESSRSALPIEHLDDFDFSFLLTQPWSGNPVIGQFESLCWPTASRSSSSVCSIFLSFLLCDAAPRPHCRRPPTYHAHGCQGGVA